MIAEQERPPEEDPQAPQLRLAVRYRDEVFELSLSPDSRLSQLAAQFHLTCCNIEGCRVVLYYRKRRISNISQRVIDIVRSDPYPTIELVASERVLKCRSNNCKFYENELRPPGLDMTIGELLEFKQNYNFLQTCNEYIQWLFPSAFKSTFNDLSHVLTEEEAKEFRRNGVIGKRVFLGYEMFLDFLGIKVLNTSGSLEIASLQRLEMALVHNVHNHMRIRRMIACLSVVGFRRLALKFLALLERLIQQYFPGKLDMIFMSSWSKFSNKNINNALKSCGFDSVSVFEEENPYVQDLTDTPYSFWKGYPNSQYGITLSQLLEIDNSTLFLEMLELLFPTRPQDIEDIRTVNGFEKRMEEVVGRTQHHFRNIEHFQAYLPEVVNSLKKLGLEKLAAKVTQF